MQNFDVIIIGAGPAGSTAAYTLAKEGISCALIEQKKTPGEPVCCGEAISEASLKTAGVLHGSYVDKKIEGFKIHFPNNKHFFVKSPGYVINRNKFDHYLFDLAVKNGAKPFLKCKAETIKRTESGFEIQTTKGAFSAKYLIGAEGPKSLVDALFFNNRTELVDATQYKLPKPHYKHDSGNYIDFYYDTLSNYYFWIFEKQKEINVGGLVKDKQILLDFIKKRFPKEDFKYEGFCRGTIPMGGIKEKIFNQNAFLIGDAAGLTNPVTFAGIYTAIISAKLAAYSIYGDLKMGKKEAPAYYEKAVRKQYFANKDMKYAAKHCYAFPQEVLDFIGEYFEGRHFGTKDVFKFLKLALMHPIIFRHLRPLLKHREILKDKYNFLW